MRCPKAAQYQATASKVAEYIKGGGQEARDRAESVVKAKAIPEFLSKMKGFGKQQGGWSVAYAAGNFGDDFMAPRQSSTTAGSGRTASRRRSTSSALTDDGKTPLDGSKTYENPLPQGRHAQCARQRVLVVDAVQRA
jgi:hypothetical protein